MQVLNKLGKEFDPLRKKLIGKISEGADGEVFRTVDSQQVIKLSIHYCWGNESTEAVIQQKEEVIKQISKVKNTFVKVLEFQHLFSGKRKTVDGWQNYLIHYYLMEKLNRISDDEVKVFHSTLSHQDRNRSPELNQEKVNQILDGLSFGLEFNKNKVVDFINKISDLEEQGINYTDLHPRNIMKNKDGDFRLIDLDRIKLFEENYES